MLLTLLQELNESIRRSHTVIEEVDGKLQHEYENRLGESLKQMREDMEQQIRQAREDTEAVFERKVFKLYIYIIIICSF